MYIIYIYMYHISYIIYIYIYYSIYHISYIIYDYIYNMISTYSFIQSVFKHTVPQRVLSKLPDAGAMEPWTVVPCLASLLP